MDSIWYSSWLVGANGVYAAGHDGTWDRIGRFDYHVNALHVAGDDIYAGVNCGLFHVSRSSGRWTQLHDETVTEVLAVAASSAPPGVAVGCPYGVATAKIDSIGSHRWSFLSDSLPVNKRFTNTLIPMDGQEGRYLVGTEGGLLVLSGVEWHSTNLAGTAVRALLYAHGTYWAGTDDLGIWTSQDGYAWNNSNSDADAVFDLAPVEKGVIAGTSRGVLMCDESGTCKASGPALRVACVAAHGTLGGHWLAGAYPGGLWVTETAGTEWSQCGGFTKLMSIVEVRA